MKKLDRLILKSFLGPLMLTFAIAVFVLLMQFVWKYIDDMVGKGLDFIIIAKLLFYASSTFVPMALPIAVLFASIMTMGNFGEKYELVAMKAGGVSLRRVMMPMAFVVLILTGVAFYFANNVLPYAMLQYRTILYDVTRKKPAINIRPSEYYTDIENYVIRINKKDADGSTLHDVIIYDHSKGSFNSNIIVADHGKMQSSADDRYLFFTLYDGCVYSEESDQNKHFTRPLTRVDFHRQVLTFDISSFAFDESDTKFFEGSYQMMNVAQLKSAATNLENTMDVRSADNLRALMEQYRGLIPQKEIDSTEMADTVPESPRVAPITQRIALDMNPAWNEPVDCRPWDQKHGISKLSKDDQARILQNASFNIRNQVDKMRMHEQAMEGNQQYINRHYIELHRKYTLSIACLLLFLVGAPFGSLVRKGGLGLPLVASVAFFVLYYVIGMICEKAVRESAMSIWGMWVSSMVLLPIGILLTVQATTDRNLAIGQWFIRMNEKRKERKNKQRNIIDETNIS